MQVFANKTKEFVHFVTLGSGKQKCLLEYLPQNDLVLLFYPGSMLCPVNYSALLNALVQKGFSVAALHFSGHGYCQKNNDFSFSTLLNNALEAEQWLLAQGHKIVIAGHSQGGILTLAHASKSQNLSLAFPITAIFPQDPEILLVTNFAKFSKYHEQIQSKLKILAKYCPNLPIPLPLYLSIKRLKHGLTQDIAQEKSYKQIILDIWHLLTGKSLARISYPLTFLLSLLETVISEISHCPVHLLGFKEDQLFNQDIITKTYEAIKAPEKSLFWLEGGHASIIEANTAEIIAIYLAQICHKANLLLDKC